MTSSSPTSRMLSLFAEEDGTQNRRRRQRQRQQHISISHQGSRTRSRRPPGTPREDAEVVILSPERLMASHWFECPVCHRGFNRQQNLNLHWVLHDKDAKLPKRDPEAGPSRKKVFLCPVIGCVYNDRARALGDITGIKKHYARKHCKERPFRCEKCSRTYAVEADIKAHSKTCRARTFTCSCGDSFPNEGRLETHKETCDALMENEVQPHSSSVSMASDEDVPASTATPAFSLDMFAPLNTNAEPFLDTISNAYAQAEDNLHPTQLHPMMMPSSSSMLPPSHEFPRANASPTAIHSSIHDLQAHPDNILDEDINLRRENYFTRLLQTPNFNNNYGAGFGDNGSIGKK